MKKILFLTFIILFCATNANAYTVSHTKDGEMQQLITSIGFKILNANKIPYRTIFTLSDKKAINAVTYLNTREIRIYKGLLPYIEKEDELAAIIAHEIGHAVESYQGIFNGAFSGLKMSLSPKKYEYKADKDGIDYMVKAGYNPVAMIVAGNKIFPQYNGDMLSTHPLSSRRLMTIYEYIYNKYPYFLANNEYINNVYYQNFLLTSNENRQKLKEKIEKKSNKRLRYL